MTKVTCILKGGLGNQLFQIFTVLTTAAKNSCPCFFVEQSQIGTGENNTTIRYTYWNTFLSGLKIYVRDANYIDSLKLPALIVKEGNFTYQPLTIYQHSKNINVLNGYFQSYKYFDDYKDTLFKLVRLEYIKEMVANKINCKKDDYTSIISLHFRQGDYKHFPNRYTILDIEYYKNCLYHWLASHPTLVLEADPYKVLYFCENADKVEVEKMINILTIEFPYFIFEHSSCVLKSTDIPLTDWEEMIQMSLYKYNIIANSTYSWWAAYFNTHVEKVIYYPTHWYSSSSNLNIQDLCLPDWIPIS